MNTDSADNNAQKNVNNSGKNTRKSMGQGYDEEVHIQSSKKVVEHVKDKHETIREYSDDPAASDGYENHNFVEQKLLTHVDQTEEIMKNRRTPYKTDDKKLNKQTDHSRQLPENRKNNFKGMQK